jgi:Xaa-Pro aminopeptidase
VASEKLERVRQILREKGLEVILFFSPENLTYLSGYTGGEGILGVSEEEAWLFVDFRYLEIAQKETKECEVRLLKKGFKEVREFLRGRDLKKIGLEAKAITLFEFGELQDPAFTFLPLSKELEALRAKKTPEEIRLIKKAVEVAENAFKEVLKLVRPGVREVEIAVELEYQMKRRGSESLPFQVIVLSGERTSLPHGVPSKKLLREGEVLLFDFGARIGGYASDETRMVFLGEVEPELKRIYEIVREAQQHALSLIKPGLSFKEVDKAARKLIEEAGYGNFFGHGTGHGVGLAVHEYPSLSPESEGELQEGMVVTVEPGIYLPQKGGVRIEDLVLVKKEGVEILTKLDHHIRV